MESNLVLLFTLQTFTTIVLGVAILHKMVSCTGTPSTNLRKRVLLPLFLAKMSSNVA